MIAVPLALLAAAANAVASVLQRRAARSVPEEFAFRPALVWSLLRSPVWLGGIGALTAGFIFQAIALSAGGLALVQPLLVAELPFTLILLGRLSRTRLDHRTWLAAGLLTAGIAGFLIAAAPAKGRHTPGTSQWVCVAVVTVGVLAALVLAARLTAGAARAAVLGLAAGIGFAFTAVFITATTRLFTAGIGTLMASWQPYAMAAAGLGSLFLLQNALQSGTLVAAQPALTISDPVASTLYGVTMFHENVRTGAWLIVEATGIALIFYGSVRLSHSSAVREESKVA